MISERRVESSCRGRSAVLGGCECEACEVSVVACVAALGLSDPTPSGVGRLESGLLGFLEGYRPFPSSLLLFGQSITAENKTLVGKEERKDGAGEATTQGSGRT